jgi:hypothetical protein
VLGGGEEPNHLSRNLKVAGLEKTRVKKKTSPVFFLGFFGFLCFLYLYICPEERVF